MAQFTVVLTDGGSYLVTAPDKYAAIEKAKSQKIKMCFLHKRRE